MTYGFENMERDAVVKEFIKHEKNRKSAYWC